MLYDPNESCSNFFNHFSENVSTDIGEGWLARNVESIESGVNAPKLVADLRFLKRWLKGARIEGSVETLGKLFLESANSRW